MSQFTTKTTRNTKKKILETFLGRKFARSKINTINIPAKQTIKIVFSILFIRENLNMLCLIVSQYITECQFVKQKLRAQVLSQYKIKDPTHDQSSNEHYCCRFEHVLYAQFFQHNSKGSKTGEVHGKNYTCNDYLLHAQIQRS